MMKICVIFLVSVFVQNVAGWMASTHLVKASNANTLRQVASPALFLPKNVRQQASPMRMNFLGFDLSELKNIGGMIVQCEGMRSNL